MIPINTIFFKILLLCVSLIAYLYFLILFTLRSYIVKYFMHQAIFRKMIEKFRRVPKMLFERKQKVLFKNSDGNLINY